MTTHTGRKPPSKLPHILLGILEEEGKPMSFREICKRVPGWNPRTVQVNLHNLISCGVVSCNVDLRDARMLIYGVRKEVKE